MFVCLTKGDMSCIIHGVDSLYKTQTGILVELGTLYLSYMVAQQVQKALVGVWYQSTHTHL